MYSTRPTHCLSALTLLAMTFGMLVPGCSDVNPNTGSVTTAATPIPKGGDGAAGFSKSEKLPQAAFLTNGPASDWGYNQTHNEGRLFAERALEGKIKTGLLENVPETADAGRTMERLIDSGVDIVVATSFGYQDSSVDTAQKHPDVKFLQVWGFKHAPNLGTYSAKMYEPWYLMGIVAARMTKSGQLGVVAAHPIPPMKWQINAYAPGSAVGEARREGYRDIYQPLVRPGPGLQATEALINQGHDVVCGVLDNSVGVAQAAERRGAWLMGHNTPIFPRSPRLATSLAPAGSGANSTGTSWGRWSRVAGPAARIASAG